MICRTRKELIDIYPRHVFISYAHIEEAWTHRLVEALAPLTSDGLVDTWHDGMLIPGDRWHAKILSALSDADLVLRVAQPEPEEKETNRFRVYHSGGVIFSATEGSRRCCTRVPIHIAMSVKPESGVKRGPGSCPDALLELF